MVSKSIPVDLSEGAGTEITLKVEGSPEPLSLDTYELYFAEEANLKMPQAEIQGLYIDGNYVSRKDYLASLGLEDTAPKAEKSLRVGKVPLDKERYDDSTLLAKHYGIDLETVVLLGEDERLRIKAGSDKTRKIVPGEIYLQALEAIAKEQETSVQKLIDSVEKWGDTTRIPADFEFTNIGDRTVPRYSELVGVIASTLKRRELIIGTKAKTQDKEEISLEVEAIEISKIYTKNNEFTVTSYYDERDSERKKQLRDLITQDEEVTHIEVDEQKLTREAYLLFYPPDKEISDIRAGKKALEKKTERTLGSRDDMFSRRIDKPISFLRTTVKKGKNAPSSKEIKIAETSLEDWVKNSDEDKRKRAGRAAENSDVEAVVAESSSTPQKIEKGAGDTRKDREAFAKALLFHIKRGSKNVYLESRGISELPAAIGLLKDCEKLVLRHNKIGKLPRSLARLTKLSYFDLKDNALGGLPNWFKQIGPHLDVLILEKNPSLGFVTPDLLPPKGHYWIETKALTYEARQASTTLSEEANFFLRDGARYSAQIKSVIGDHDFTKYNDEENSQDFAQFLRDTKFSISPKIPGHTSLINDHIFQMGVARIFIAMEDPEIRNAVFSASRRINSRSRNTEDKLTQFDEVITAEKFRQKKISPAEMIAREVVEYRLSILSRIAEARQRYLVEHTKTSRDVPPITGLYRDYCTNLSGPLKLMPFFHFEGGSNPGLNTPQFNQAEKIIQHLEKGELEKADTEASRNLGWNKAGPQFKPLSEYLTEQPNVKAWLDEQLKPEFERIEKEVKAEFKERREAFREQWDYKKYSEVDTNPKTNPTFNPKDPKFLKEYPFFEHRKDIKDQGEYLTEANKIVTDEAEEIKARQKFRRYEMMQQRLTAMKDEIYTHVNSRYDNDPLRAEHANTKKSEKQLDVSTPALEKVKEPKKTGVKR